jgi:hypothetical protein
MTGGRSLLPVFGLWVAWVHVLSLVVLSPLGRVPDAAPRPSVRFVDAEEFHVVDPESGPNALRQVAAELSEPLDHAIEIPVSTIPVASPSQGIAAATPGVDFTAARDAVFVFPAHETRGYLRERGSLLDVTVTPDPSAAEPRRFRLQLEGTDDVVVAPDPLAFRTVEIPVAGRPVAGRGNPAHFREALVDVDERDLLDHRFIVDAKRPPTEEAELLFSLYRIVGTGRSPVQHFRGRFPAGADEMSFSLRELVPAEDLERIGAAYDARPGIDEWYELHLDARPPLISAEDPCLTTIFCRDRDGVADVTFEVEDESGRPVQRILPGTPFWVVANLSRPIEVDCPVTLVIDGKPLTPGGVIPAGTRRSDRMGPYRLDRPADDSREDVLVSLATRPDAGHGQCRACGGRPGGCGTCRGTCRACGGPPGTCAACEGDCPQCGGRPGGCPTCRAVCAKCKGAPGGCEACRSRCGQCGGRKGGCAACGNGSGVCRGCGGGAGGCGLCRGGGSGGGAGSGNGSGGGGGGGSGAGGTGGGGGGGGGSGSGSGGGTGSGGGGGSGNGGGSGGGGGGGAGRSPVAAPSSTPIPVGPPVPGDFMIFLVNNQRLHEPGDVITEQVRDAIRDRHPYKQGVIVINSDEQESLLTTTAGEPAPERTFEPFSAEAQDLGGQTARIVETIARKRKNAEKADIRTLVVWPEREVVSAPNLDVFKALANDGRGPISFLFPDADPERARELAAALTATTGDAADVTVRSPKSGELVEHLTDVLDAIGAAPTDRLNTERTTR